MEKHFFLLRAPEGGRRTEPPPPPRQTDPRGAGRAAPGARGRRMAPADQAYLAGMRQQRRGLWAGGHRAPPQTREVGNHSATSPLLSLRAPPLSRGMPETGHALPPSLLGGIPPSPRKGRGARGGMLLSPYAAPPHAPHPPAPAGAGTGKRTGASAQWRHTDRARGQHANTNRSSMGATPSVTRATSMTPALLPAQGRQRGGPR